jgi:hypothetical protein
MTALLLAAFWLCGVVACWLFMTLDAPPRRKPNSHGRN